MIVKAKMELADIEFSGTKYYLIIMTKLRLGHGYVFKRRLLSVLNVDGGFN
jgi:hypothetical protein